MIYNQKKNTTKFIENNLKGEISILLSTRHRLKKLLTQTDISIDGKSCIPIIINDYNLFFGTNNSVESSIIDNPFLGTQQSFVCDKKTFERLGLFLSYIIEEKINRIYNPLPATVFERYIAMFFHFQLNRIYLSLTHNAIGYHSGYKQ